MAESKKYNYVYMSGLTLLTVMLGVWKMPGSPGPRQTDLLHKAAAILNGQAPYRDFTESGPPGVLYIYALALKIFGNDYISINIVDIIWRCAAAVAIFLLAEKLSGKLAGVIAGALYALMISIFCASPQCHALPASFAVFPVALSLYFFLGEKITSSTVSGLLMGIAGLIKAPALLLAPALIAVVLIRPRVTWEPRPKRAKIFSYLYGIIMVWSMFVFYLLLSWSIVHFFHQLVIFNLYNTSDLLIA